MILSEDRQSHFARVIIDKLYDDDVMDFEDDDERLVLKTVKMSIIKFVKDHESIEESVRYKISSLKRNVIEGTSEWNALYDKYMREEGDKKNR